MPIPGNLPKAGQDLWESTMLGLKGKKNPRTGKPYTDEERAKISWSVVGKKYKKKGDVWEAKEVEGFDMDIPTELLEFKSEGGNYFFKGYLSTFDVDLVNDLVTPDCMKDMLDQINFGIAGYTRSIKGSPDHDVYHKNDQQLVPISKITSGALDDKGLFIEGQFNKDHPEFKDIWSQVENGFLDGLSIEYKPTDFAYKEMDNKRVRVLNRVQLKGYGHTPRPANPYSKLTDFFIKSLEVAEAEEVIEIKGLKETVSAHLHEDIKEYEKMIADDKEMLAGLEKLDDVKEEDNMPEDKKPEDEEEEERKKKEKEAAEKKECSSPEAKKEEEKKPEVKSEPQPPVAEVKLPETVEVKAEPVKEEGKSQLDIEQIKSVLLPLIRDEVKNLIPKKEALSDTSDKFAGEVKSDGSLVGLIARALGGK